MIAEPDRLEPPTPAAVAAHDLGVDLGGRRILDGIDVHAHRGTITGVVGRSGTGKTTLLRVLAGLVAHQRGSVSYGTRSTPRPGEIGMLAQHPRKVTNPRWTLRRIITEPADIRGDRRADLPAIAERVGLRDDLLDRRPAQVSDGQLQRACLGRLLVAAPTVVLCDEPTSMLDPHAARAVADLLTDLAAGGAALVVVSHQQRLIDSRCSDVLRLE